MSDAPALQDGERFVCVRASARVSGPARPMVATLRCDCGDEFVPRFPGETQCALCRPRWAA